ncbi:MAG: hypothetical protein ACJ8AY_15110, partial [Gemmatimonadales bacterium]
ALDRAMDEVLGGRVDGLRNLIRSNHRPAWAAVPKPEAIILWLRNSEVSLFCAYPIDVLGPDFQSEKVDQLLCTHTHLVPLNPGLDEALGQAMQEVLGPRLDELRESMGGNHRPAWGTIPPAEALVLWLRNNLPDSADEILTRAREYYRRAS